MLKYAAIARHDTGHDASKESLMPITRPDRSASDWDQALNFVAIRQDKQAYAELFNYFAPRLKQFGLKMFGNEQQALEMVQDTMLNVWKKATLFDANKGCASTWIYSIARNVRFDMLRKKQSRKDDISADDLWGDGEYAPDDSEDAAISWDNQLLSAKLLPHFNQLPTGQRQVMEKVYLEEKTHQQVAEELALPLGTVKSRIRLALDRLREALDGTRN